MTVVFVEHSHHRILNKIAEQSELITNALNFIKTLASASQDQLDRDLDPWSNLDALQMQTDSVKGHVRELFTLVETAKLFNVNPDLIDQARSNSAVTPFEFAHQP